MKNYILHTIAGLICFVAGLGLQINVDRDFVVTMEGTNVMDVTQTGQKVRASWDLVQYNDSYKTKTGAPLLRVK